MIELHLLYASVVWIAAWLLTSLPRGSATVKYWIWVATSINFLLPLGTIPARYWPTSVSWLTPRIALLDVVDRVPITAPLVAIWIAGSVVMLVRLYARARDSRGAATPMVIGLVRTRVLLPDGIERVLTREELDAVLTHESMHARRRDNLIRLIHEVSVCFFWFHPFVWMTRSRLALYRELSCDEAVVQQDDLVSALAKLAEPLEPGLLHATASSFIGTRLARLTRRERSTTKANAILIALFAAILLASAIAPVAQSEARALCIAEHSH